MNKGLIIAVVLVILLLLGGGAFLMSQNSNPESQNSNDTSQATNTQSETADSSKSVKDLFNLSSAQECTFSDTSGNGGTIYVANKKMRGDFKTTTPQGTMNSSMIIDGNTSYIWTEDQTTGVKMSFDINATSDTKTNSSGVDLDKKVDYNCKTWVVNNSMFTLPKEITFSDFGSLMVPSASSNPASGSGGSTGSKAEQCAVCDQAPADYKAQCKQALGCN